VNALVLAMSLGGILDNGWNWATDNPWLALGIVVGAMVLGAAGMLLIAGSAGWLAGTGILINVMYGGVGALVGGGLACAAIAGGASLGGGGSSETGPPEMRGTISYLVVSLEDGNDTLRAEVWFQGDRAPRIETWSRYDMSQKVDGIVSEIAESRPEQRTLQIKFLNVPERIQEMVVEEFRLHEVMLAVEEEEKP